MVTDMKSQGSHRTVASNFITPLKMPPSQPVTCSQSHETPPPKLSMAASAVPCV